MRCLCAVWRAVHQCVGCCLHTCSEWTCYPRRNYSRRPQRKCNLEAIEIDPIESLVRGNLLRRRKAAAPAANRFGIFCSCIGCTRTSPLLPRLYGSGTTQRKISFDSSYSAVVQRPIRENPSRCRNRCSARANKCCMSIGCSSKRPVCPQSRPLTRPKLISGFRPLLPFVQFAVL